MQSIQSAYHRHASLARARARVALRNISIAQQAIKQAYALHGVLPFAASELPRGLPVHLLARGYAAPCGNAQHLRITPSGLRYAGLLA